MNEVSLTAKDRLICRAALEGYVESLRKLAKRLEGVGEVAMASTLLTQSDYIATTLSDRFRDQGSLPLEEQ